MKLKYSIILSSILAVSSTPGSSGAEIPNVLTLNVVVTPKCSNPSLTFCVDEQIPNNQILSMTLSLDKGTVTLSTPLALTPVPEEFTLTPTSTCPTTTTFTASTTPCTLNLTYAPKGPTVDENNKPVVKQAALNFTYTNSLSKSVTLTKNMSYQANSLLGAPAQIPLGVDLSKVIQANVIGKNVVMRTNTDDLNTLYSTFSTPLPHILFYNANQLSAGRVIAQGDYDPQTFSYPFYAIETLAFPLFSKQPMGIAVGKNATYGFFSDGTTNCIPTNFCTNPFVPQQANLFVNVHNYHFVDTSGLADKLYIYANPLPSEANGVYLASLNPMTGELFARSTTAVFQDGTQRVLYSLAINNKIFVTLYDLNSGYTTFQGYNEIDATSSSLGTITTATALYSTPSTIPFAPVYDAANKIIYFVTLEDSTLHAIKLDTGKSWASKPFSKPISAPFIIGKNNNVAVVCEDGNIYIYNSAGTSVLIYSSLNEAGQMNSAAVSFDSTNSLIYIPTSGTASTSSGTLGKAPTIYSFRTNW